MEIFAIFALFIVIAVVFRLIAGTMDHDRVSEYIESNGGCVIEKHWTPFGTGWFGEKNSRIYEVRYQDRDGNIHLATCKTSLFSGVYLTEDRIIESPSIPTPTPPPDPEKESLDAENCQLREELEKLKQNRT